jgi:copper(I)-binding protein
MRHLFFVFIALFASLGWLAEERPATAHQIKAGSLIIVHPWCRQLPLKPDTAAGFMKIINTGADDDRLVKVTADVAANVAIVNMVADGNVFKMDEMPDGLLLPAGQTVALAAKSYHLMFTGLKSPLTPDTEFSASLYFEKAGRVTVDFEVNETSSERGPEYLIAPLVASLH